MLTLQMLDFLHELRLGTLDAAHAAFLDHISANDFISELRTTYPLLFQERSIGRKHEVGMALSVRYEAHHVSDSLFLSLRLIPFLSQCIMVSSYDDVISEVTATKSVRVRPARESSNQVILKLGPGFKLDKTPDEWAVRLLKRRTVTLSADFLQKRGWNFAALSSFRPIS